MYQTNPFCLVGYKKATPSGPTLLTLFIINGLLVIGILVPNVLANDAKGSNINAVPTDPTILKKSRRETESNLGIMLLIDL
jgi:hypothetical protein